MMSRKLLILAASIVGIVVIFFVFRYVTTGRAPKQGVLKVSTNTAAKILIENRELGKTPYEGKVNAGQYSIRLVPQEAGKNVSSWQGNITIGPNVLTYINRDLSESELTSAGEILWLEKIGSNKAELTVTSVPDGSQVIVNDQSKGVSPITLTDLSIGDHTLLVSSPGFEPRTIKIKLTAGYKLTAGISLALSPGQMVNIQPDIVAPTATPSASIASTVSTTPTKAISPTPTTKLSPTPTPVVMPKKVVIKSTPTGFLRVRSEPSTAAEEVGRVKPTEQYAVLEMKTVSQVRWYKITFTETLDGWISGEYAEGVN